MQSFSANRFAEIMGAIFGEIGSFNQSDYVQTFEIVNEGFKKSGR
jgi:hypothetical protein